jgi:hypothetical protein
VFAHAGAYYQSRVSFFNDVQKLALHSGFLVTHHGHLRRRWVSG